MAPISVPSDFTKVDLGEGYSAYELGPSSAPAIVLIQAWWGVTQEMIEHAYTIEKKGYRVAIPDLYLGSIAESVLEAKHMMGELDFAGAEGAMKRLAAHVRSTGSPKVGALGFCMGGALAVLAARSAEIDCSVSCYGIPGAALASPSDPVAPTLYVMGTRDHTMGFSDPDTVHAWVKASLDAGRPASLLEYEADHAFLAEGDKSEEHRQLTGHEPPLKEVQAKAWSDIYDYLAKHLKA